MSCAVSVNEHFVPRIDTFGNEGTSLIVIDEWSSNAKQLASYPPHDIADWTQPSTLFPGLWAAPPDNYAQQLVASLSSIIRRTFTGHETDYEQSPQHVFCCYAAITSAPTDLERAQTMPHFDTLDGPQLAVIHYLCSSEHSGTAFYRHRQTGYERISRERWPQYKQCLDDQPSPLDKSYVDVDDDHFECIQQYPVKFNRLLVYPSDALHSGLVRSPLDYATSADARRLTITSFLSYY